MNNEKTEMINKHLLKQMAADMVDCEDYIISDSGEIILYTGVYKHSDGNLYDFPEKP